MYRRDVLVGTGVSLSVAVAGCLGEEDTDEECPVSGTDRPYTPECADGIGTFWGYLVRDPPGEEPVSDATDVQDGTAAIVQAIADQSRTTPEEELGGILTEDDDVYRRVTVPTDETTAEERESAAEYLQRLPAGEHPDLGVGWYLDFGEKTLFVTYGAWRLPD